MKDSKEALKNLTYCVNGMESKEKYYKIIKQDLDRLEKLEKENQELRKSIKSWNENGGNLLKENIKLKKAIKILKDKLKLKLNFSEFKNSEAINAILPLAGSNLISLTPDEYEPLKEVLGNER